MNKIAKGFTLIELLIVIALLGALAVALLAALDPLEQIKKGTDTGVRNTVSEISGSFTRYASVKAGELPVPTGPITWQVIGATDGTDVQTSGTDGQKAIAAAITAGELKADFFTLAGDQLDKIYIAGVYDDTQQKVYVCFRPTAKSFLADKNTKYYYPSGTTDGVMSESATCPDNAGINTTPGSNETCYWCVQ